MHCLLIASFMHHVLATGLMHYVLTTDLTHSVMITGLTDCVLITELMSSIMLLAWCAIFWFQAIDCTALSLITSANRNELNGIRIHMLNLLILNQFHPVNLVPTALISGCSIVPFIPCFPVQNLTQCPSLGSTRQAAVNILVSCLNLFHAGRMAQATCEDSKSKRCVFPIACHTDVLFGVTLPMSVVTYPECSPDINMAMIVYISLVTRYDVRP